MKKYENVTIENDIMVIDHFMSDDECDAIVDMYSEMFNEGVTRDMINQKPMEFDDTAVYISTREYFSEHPQEIHNFSEKLWTEAWPIYEEAYPILKQEPNSGVTYMNFGMSIFKTEPKQGLHKFHCETSDASTASRTNAIILYLNDDFEAGETEFLYQSVRIKPQKGTLVFFPAHFTHTHRGNPPIGGTKYIISSGIHRVTSV